MDRSMGSMKTAGGASVGLPGDAADPSMGGAPTLRGGSPGRRFRAGEVILGRYRVTGELGQGGMGIVYRCFDETAGIEVALKALPPEVGHNSGEMDEVRENFRLVERLHHPNIASVKTLEKDPASGDYYLIMECVDGLDLRQWARKRRSEGRPLTTDEIVIVAHRIAAALDYAHEQRVIHRDIKPANVRVNFEGDVKVLDFGLAAQLHTSMSRVSQAYRGTSGTGPYMAPEQWRGQRQDARADQYALAATVYELFAGAPPFESHDIGVLRAAVLNERPPLLENAPPHVNAALRRGLAKEPAERFATCGEFVAALGNANIKPQSAQRHGGKKVALWLAAAAVAMGYGAYRTYGTYSARRAEARAQAEQAAALDAAQREKLEGLKAAAEAALAGGDLEAAGARIAELKGVGGRASPPGGRASPRAVEDLQKKYEAKAGERETNKRYAAASVAREAAQKLDRGQGFGARLDALEVTWREAEAARQGQGWGQALSGYDAALAVCKALEELEVKRRDAEARRGDFEKAKTGAEQAGAANDAADLFAAGGRASPRAEEAFEKGLFTEASKAWQESAASFTSAKTRALAVQSYVQAKAAFETELSKSEPSAGGRASPRAVLLDARGGAKWAEVKRLRTLGAASANDPVAGKKAYLDALAALPAAVTEAVAAEQAEADRLAAEKRAREEQERQEKVSSALDAARAAKAAGQWQACIDKAGEALTLETGGRASPRAAVTDEAQALKREAEIALKPKGPSPGDVQAVDLGGGVTLEMVWCPRGSYTRGSPANEAGRSDDETQHRVTLTKGFWMGKHEVTQAQWEAVTGSNPSRFKNAGKSAPVENVSWDDCQEFVRKLNAKLAARGDARPPDGGGFRLPTEAEWEYACRAPSAGSGQAGTSAFHYGNDLDATMANFDGNYPYGNGRKGEYRRTTVPVGTFRANAWGLYDMHGNVWEWCQDWYGDYPTVSVTDPAGPGSGSFRVLRGGCWLIGARGCRSANRDWGGPGCRGGNLGLRLARDPQ